MHCRTFYSDAEITPVKGFLPTGVLVADVQPAGKGYPAVDDGNLAMISFVEPGNAVAKRGRVEGGAVDPAFGKSAEIRGGSIETADIIVKQADLDPTLCGFFEQPGQMLAGSVRPDDIKFQIN